MTPRKARNSNPQTQAVQASDYESDAFYAPPQAVPTRTNTELNLSVLRRYHSSIQTILSIASSAHIYRLTPPETRWVQTEIEGTLFVCQLAPATLTSTAQHSIVVLNRKGLENLIIDLNSVDEMQVQDPFLMLGFRSQGEGELGEEKMVTNMLGVWISTPEHDTTTRDDNVRLIQEKWEEKQRRGDNGGELVQARSEELLGRRLSLSELFAGKVYSNVQDD